MPERIRLSRAKGYRMPANTVKVDRSTPWGNPFVVGKDGTQAECVRSYVILLSGLLAISVRNVDAQKKASRYVHEHKHELKGKNLACWCRHGTACHADVLLLLANYNKATASRKIMAYLAKWFPDD